MLAVAARFFLSADPAVMGPVVPFCFCFPVVAVVGVAAFAFWIWTIINLATNEPAQDQNKIVWLLVVVFLHSIGALIYYLVRRPERIRLYGK